MKILSTSQIRSLEEREISAGTPAEVLMEGAGRETARLIIAEYPQVKTAHIWVGKGNNGEDGLVIGRELIKVGWKILVWLAYPSTELGELGIRKLAELRSEFPAVLVKEKGIARIWPKSDELLIDSLLGIGGKGDLRGAMRELVAEINKARRCCFFRTVAIDCPSGLNEESRSLKENLLGGDQAIVADLTVTIGYGKTFLFREELSSWVGRILVAPIFQIEPEANTNSEAIVAEEVRPLLPRRNAASHKYDLGRVLIIAGSPGMTGAPRLTSEAALRAGAGLVTLGVRTQIYPMLATAAAPECLVFDLDNSVAFEQSLSKATVVAMGPGMGLDPLAEQFLRQVIERYDGPLILDADALTLLAKDLSWLNNVAHMSKRKSQSSERRPIILTPHPGEMKRLLGQDFTLGERESVARDFAWTHGVHLILKGCRTVVAHPSGKVWINTTGNAGMACGGSGDTLLGILAALVAQGLSCEEAMKLGVWWHGRAADLALRERGCEEGLPIAEVLRCLPKALNGSLSS